MTVAVVLAVWFASSLVAGPIVGRWLARSSAHGSVPLAELAVAS